MEGMILKLTGDINADKVRKYIVNNMSMNNKNISEHVELFIKVTGKQLVWSDSHLGMDNPLRDASVKNMVQEYRTSLVQ